MKKISLPISLKISFSLRIFIIAFLVIMIMTVSFTALSIQAEKKDHINSLVKKGELLSCFLRIAQGSDSFLKMSSC